MTNLYDFFSSVVEITSNIQHHKIWNCQTEQDQLGVKVASIFVRSVLLVGDSEEALSIDHKNAIAVGDRVKSAFVLSKLI